MNILRQRSLQLSASSWTLLTAIVEEVVPNEIAKSLLLARNGAPNRPDGMGLAKCTEAHFQDFTESCKAALVKIASQIEACGADIHEQCPDIKPNAGRILLCVKQHFTSLSDSCKAAISNAAERKVRAHIKTAQ